MNYKEIIHKYLPPIVFITAAVIAGYLWYKDSGRPLPPQTPRTISQPAPSNKTHPLKETRLENIIGSD